MKRKAKVSILLSLGLFLVMMFGCGSANETTLSTADEVTLSEYDEVESSLFAAPKKDKKKDELVPEPEPDTPAPVVSYYTEGWVGPEGGSIKVQKEYGDDKTQLKFDPGALDGDTLITMLITTNHDDFVELEFGPHTPEFGAKVKLDLYWGYLPVENANKELTLYYWNNGEWQPEVTGEWEKQDKKVSLKIPHFSRYYFERR